MFTRADSLLSGAGTAVLLGFSVLVVVVVFAVVIVGALHRSVRGL